MLVLLVLLATVIRPTDAGQLAIVGNGSAASLFLPGKVYIKFSLDNNNKALNAAKAAVSTSAAQTVSTALLQQFCAILEQQRQSSRGKKPINYCK